MEYFAQVKTVQGATKRYRALAKKWHPDRNGSIIAGAVMAEINRQYKTVLVAFANEYKDRVATNFSDNQEFLTQDHVTNTEIYTGPNDGSDGRHFESSRRPQGRSLSAKNVVRALVSDREIARVGDVAESLIANAAKAMISKAIIALNRWKSEQ